MTDIRGSQKTIAMGLASTFGTPVALGTGKKIEVESYNDSENTVELTANPIGGGVMMQTQSERGQASPTVDIELLAGYNDAGVEAVAQFFGTAAVSSVVAGAFEHTFTMSETFNAEWLTVADQKTTEKTAEYPSCAVTSLSFSAETNDYLRLSMNLLANLQDLDSSVNDVDQLADATVADTQRVVIRPENEFRINAQGGAALAVGDIEDIVSADIVYNKPQEHVAEVRGAAGNGEPESAEGIPIDATLTIVRKTQKDISFMEAHQAGTEYKACFLNEGPILTGSTKYAYEFYFPRLKLVEPVDAPANSPGRNAETITFRVLKATENPTGMTDTYPYIKIVNSREEKYEA